MRYFRDLGVDAHLLLYANDGFGSLGHFAPEGDTWDFARWRPYIHQTSIPNTPIASLDAPWSWAVAIRSWLRAMLKRQDFVERPVSKPLIRELCSGYDKIIGSGISPAALGRAGISLDVFYPYSTGIEYVDAYAFAGRLQASSPIGRQFYRLVAKKQIAGIQTARLVVKCESGQTQQVLEDIGVRAVTLMIPMVYSNEVLPDAAPSETLRQACEVLNRSRLTILHQARLIFRNSSGLDDAEWVHQSKNNHWLLHAFARVVAGRPHLNPQLLMVEYGQDVDAAKRLIAELGIVENVCWLPLLQRRELMWLMSRVMIGCGEFYDLPRMIWGGTGWEALASGKLLLQGFNFEEGEFERVYGYAPPPMLPVRTRADIEAHLFNVADHPAKAELIGRAGGAWFHQHNGVGLAKQWLALLQNDGAGNGRAMANA